MQQIDGDLEKWRRTEPFYGHKLEIGRFEVTSGSLEPRLAWLGLLLRSFRAKPVAEDVSFYKTSAHRFGKDS